MTSIIYKISIKASFRSTNFIFRHHVQTTSGAPPALRGYIQKFPDEVDNEINNNNNSLRGVTKGHGRKTH
jgi:hypothetical protein